MTVLLGIGIIIVGLAVLVAVFAFSCIYAKALTAVSVVALVVGLGGLIGAAIQNEGDAPWKGLAVGGCIGLVFGAIGLIYQDDQKDQRDWKGRKC